jgi:hypothetical protein
MLRWILLLVALLAFGFLFQARSLGAMWLALIVATVSLLWSLGSFLAARVGSVSQGQSTREIELLLSARKHSGAASSSRNPAPDEDS